MGGFRVGDNIAFLTSSHPQCYYEEFQHKISSARLCPPLSVDFIKDADEYAKQGEKQLQRVLFKAFMSYEVKNSLILTIGPLFTGS